MAMFSPDGQWLAYTSNESGQSEVYVRPYPQGTQRLVSDGGGTAPLWSREGQELYYRNSSNNLVAVPIQTNPSFLPGRQRELFPVEFRTSLGATAYDSYGEGFIMVEQLQTTVESSPPIKPFPPTQERHQITQNSGAFPVWSREGTTLFYRHAALELGARDRLYSVSTATEGAFTFGSEEELPFRGIVTINGYRDYDITPNGQSIGKAEGAAAWGRRSQFAVLRACQTPFKSGFSDPASRGAVLGRVLGGGRRDRHQDGRNNHDEQVSRQLSHATIPFP